MSNRETLRKPGTRLKDLLINKLRATSKLRFSAVNLYFQIKFLSRQHITLHIIGGNGFARQDN